MPARDPADPIALLLEGRYQDPVTGEALRAESTSVVIEDSLDGREVELVSALGLGPRLALISDANTFAALGDRVRRALGTRYTIENIIIDTPHADADTVARLAAALDPGTDAVVAVGSGTLNDLCKMVALERGRPQVVFATAPSMNGYTSVSASITSGGVKRSVRAATPVAAFFDLGVLASAPRRLIRAGLGDSSCRPTAQADWLLAHLLLDRPYREAPFALLAADEEALFANVRALIGGDLAAMRVLVRTLVLSGFGMTLTGGSFPASQGEHLLSHYMEMMHPSDTLHGEQIAVGTIAMARLQDRILAHDTPPILQAGPDRDDLLRHFGPDVGEACWIEFVQKRCDRAQTEQLNERLATSWDAIRGRIQAVTLGAPKLIEILEAAGVPTDPAALGWSPTLFGEALQHAREIRNRYTFLDLAADSGL